MTREKVSPNLSSALHDQTNHLAREDLDEDAEDLQVPLEHEQQYPSHETSTPDNFRTTVQGRNVNVRRVPTSEADHVLYNRGLDHEGQERAPVNEHGLSYSDTQGQPHHFGMQDGLPPLKELESHETSQTQKEKEEIQHRQNEAQQEYYNQYRNPIARLRAQYPQASAEFLAVRIPFHPDQALLTSTDFRLPFPRNMRKSFRGHV